MDEYVGSLFLATTAAATATAADDDGQQQNGQQNNNIGNDEHPIAFIQFSLIHTKNKQVLWTVSQLVKGEDEEEDINGNDLSEEFKSKFPEADNNPPVSLATAVHVIRQAIEASSLASPVQLLVTDGEHPLRQCFHPQAKDIPDLPDLFFSFLDLRKLARKFHPLYHQVSSFSEEGEEEQDSVVETISQQLTVGLEDCTKNNIQKINQVFLHLLENPVVLEETHHPETIQTKLEAGICTKGENVDGNCVVRARGLPWQSSDQDVARFFRGLNIAKGGVALCLSAQGRRNGEALVRFESSYQRDLGLKRHKHHIGSRYIEVYKASGEDFISVAGGCNNEAHAFLSKGAQVIVRMRGLPYDCSHQQVIDFFENGEGGETSCSVLEKEEGVLFVKRPDGRATGDAFVLFQDEEDAAKALAKHKQSIGPRYIELFRSTAAEVQQVLNRCVEPPPPLQQQQVVSPLNHLHHNHHHNPQQQYHNLSSSSSAANNSNKSSLPSPELIHAAAAAAAAAAAHNNHHHHHHHLPLLHHQLAPLSPPLLTHQAALSPSSAAAASASSSVLPQQHLITSGTRKDCIRLRGLPYEAQVEHILEFLGEYAKNIVYQGVHMVYNAQGQPSGEAFIQMDSETSAFLSAQGKHHRYMMHFKKQRYIEVFQCSGFDMQQVLSGGGGGGSGQQLKDQSLLPGGGLYYIQQQQLNNRLQQEQQQTTTTTVFYYYPPPPPHPYYNQIPYNNANPTTTSTQHHHHHQDLMLMKQQEKLSIRLGLA